MESAIRYFAYTFQDNLHVSNDHCIKVHEYDASSELDICRFCWSPIEHDVRAIEPVISELAEWTKRQECEELPYLKRSNQP